MRALHNQGKQVWLISGDVPGAVGRWPQRLNIDHWQAEALPQDKADKVATLQAEGRQGADGGRRAE